MARIEVNPMTEKDYIEWYREKYNIEPPHKFLKTCIDNYQREFLAPSEDEDWLKELIGDDMEERLK